MVASPARGQLNREMFILLFPPAIPLILHAQAESSIIIIINLAFNHDIPSAFRDGVHLFLQSTVIESAPS